VDWYIEFVLLRLSAAREAERSERTKE
jgi:hypothetical protein